MGGLPLDYNCGLLILGIQSAFLLMDELERLACEPQHISYEEFNKAAHIPYGCTTNNYGKRHTKWLRQIDGELDLQSI